MASCPRCRAPVVVAGGVWDCRACGFPRPPRLPETWTTRVSCALGAAAMSLLFVLLALWPFLVGGPWFPAAAWFRLLGLSQLLGGVAFFLATVTPPGPDRSPMARAGLRLSAATLVLGLLVMTVLAAWYYYALSQIET